MGDKHKTLKDDVILTLWGRFEKFLDKIISYFHLSLADRGVNALEDGAGECCSFTSSRLSLGDHVSSLHYWLDCSLLDGGGFLESVCVDSSDKCGNFKYLL